MPQPTAGDVHVNTPLTNISIAYLQDLQQFVATRVFPSLPVQKQSDKYFEYPKEYWNRTEVQERAPGKESAGSGYKVNSSSTYYAPIYAVHKDIADPVRANADPAINMDREATEWVTRQLAMKREKLWASKYFTTGLWTGDQTGAAAAGANQFKYWSSPGSTPVDDLTAQGVVIAKRTGFRPNKLVIGPEVWDKLRNHADVLDRIKYTQRGVVTEDLIASLIGVDEVLVAWAIETTSGEGAATETSAFIAGKHALLCYAAPNPGLLTPSAGYTFGWTGYLGAGPEGNRIKRFRMEALESDRVEGQMAFDQKLISADMAVFFSGAVE